MLHILGVVIISGAPDTGRMKTVPVVRSGVVMIATKRPMVSFVWSVGMGGRAECAVKGLIYISGCLVVCSMYGAKLI